MSKTIVIYIFFMWKYYLPLFSADIMAGDLHYAEKYHFMQYNLFLSLNLGKVICWEQWSSSKCADQMLGMSKQSSTET